MMDLALMRVRAIFGSIQGVSSPPPVGGNIRSVVVNLDPERLRAYRLSPDDVVAALGAGNLVVPSGNARIHDQAPMVPWNAMVVDPQVLGSIPVRPGENLYNRDLSTITDAMDIATGYALVNGKRSIFLMVSKRADASTLAVVNALKANLPRMQKLLPPDMHIRFELDQSPFVTRAIWGVGSEGLLGAVLIIQALISQEKLVENRSDPSTGSACGTSSGGSPDTRARTRPEGLADEIDPDSRPVRKAEGALYPAPRAPLGRLGRLREWAGNALARLRSSRPAEAHPPGAVRRKSVLEFRIERHMRMVHRALDQIRELNPKGMTRDEVPEDVWASLAERGERVLLDIIDAEVRFWAAIIAHHPMIRLSGNEEVWVGRVVRLANIIRNSDGRRQGNLDFLRDWASHEGRARPRPD
jgi:hypothetical protein